MVGGWRRIELMLKVWNAVERVWIMMKSTKLLDKTIKNDYIGEYYG